jgi:hypothetical protein
MPWAASPPYGKYAWDCAIIFEVSGLVSIYVNELTVSGLNVPLAICSSCLNLDTHHRKQEAARLHTSM